MSKQLTAVAMLALMAGTALANPRESQAGPAFLNIYGASFTPDQFTLDFLGSDGGGSYQATHVIVTGTQNSTAADGFDYASESHMTVTPPGGAGVDVQLNVGNAYTSLPVNVTKSLGAAVPTAGTWTFSLNNTFQDDTAGPDATLTDCVITLDDSVILPPPPGATYDSAIDLGTLVDDTNVTATAEVPAGGFVWYKFLADEASGAAGRKLSMGTLNSTNGGDSEICIYDGATSQGLYYSDDFNGPFSFLSFGSGGLAGDLAAGEYYVIVASYATTFYLDPNAVTSTGAGGTFQLDVIQENVGVPVPPSATDLGTLVDGVTVTQQVSVPAAGVVWFKATVDDCSAAAGRELTISTANSDPFAGDTEIGVYTDTGAAVAIDDQSGGNDLSLLAFGFNGFNGDLAPGTYYIPVTTYPGTFYIQGWNVTSTGTGGDFQLDVLQTTSFPASATATATSTADGGLFQVTVTPGTNPDSTGIVVTGDLSALGGSSTQAFFDDGTHGDVVAGDNTFSYLAPIPSGGSDGQAYAATYTVIDDQGDNLTGDMTIAGPDVNNSIATAIVPSGTGQLDSVSDNLDSDGDVDMFKISICDSSSFSATTVGGTTADTKLYLFNPDGTGVTSDDDDPSGTGGLQSTITGVFVPGNGDYYLAVTRYPVLAIDAGGNDLWAPTPFNVERQPDGPGAGGVLAGFTGASFGTASYTVAFTGTCYPTNNTQCSVADVGIAGGLPGSDHHLDNNDFISFISLFFAQSATADMGSAGGLPGADGAWDNNDFIAFINHFFADSGACNGG